MRKRRKKGLGSELGAELASFKIGKSKQSLFDILTGKGKDSGLPDLYASSMGRFEKRKRGIPDLDGGVSSRAYHAVPDLSGTGGRRGGRSVPDISGDGRPDPTLSNAPSIGAAPGGTRRGAGRGGVPDLGASGSEPGRNGELNISASSGGELTDTVETWRKGVVEGVLAYLGIRDLTPAEEREFDRFLKAAHVYEKETGAEVSKRWILEQRVQIMTKQMSVKDLWETPLGQVIQEVQRDQQKYVREQQEKKDDERQMISDGVRSLFGKQRQRYLED